jgi:hypothetical protein
MDSNKVQQLRNECESIISALIPEIAQLIQQHQASGILKTRYKIESGGCKLRPIPPGGIDCTSVPCNLSNLPIMEFVCGLLSFGETSESDTEIAQQFWADIASKFFELITFLSQSIQQTGEIFEVHLVINAATVNPEQPVVCQWISDDILKCSQP